MNITAKKCSYHILYRS